MTARLVALENCFLNINLLTNYYSMNEKHRQVQSWLDQVFAGETVPEYEINPRSIDILYDLMLQNQRSDHGATLVTEDWRQKADEYSSEAGRLSRILKKMGLTPGLLSQSGTVSLRTLTNTASILQTKDASDTSLLRGLSQLGDASSRLEEEVREEHRLSAKLDSKITSAQYKSQTLNKTLQAADELWREQERDVEKKLTHTGFLNKKRRDYQQHIQKLEADLAASGAHPTIYHSALVKQAQQLRELKEKLHPLSAKLDSYQKLPPDEGLTRVKVEEVRRELNALEKELAKNIDCMHM